MKGQLIHDHRVRLGWLHGNLRRRLSGGLGLAALMQSGKPNRRGKGSQRMAVWYDSQKALMFRRDQYCVNCGSARNLTPEHVFGRTGTDARLGTPWCHMKELLAALCWGCHNDKTDGHSPALVETMKARAIERFVARLTKDGLIPPTSIENEPQNSFMRRLTEFAQSVDWRPDTMELTGHRVDQ